MFASVKIGFGLLLICVATSGVFAAQAGVYATTPQQTAIAALFRSSDSGITVVRSNVVGRYAVVLTHGGKLESDAVIDPILVERFSFGWQTLALMNGTCFLAAQAFSVQVRARLMQGMPSPGFEPNCLGVTNDTGPASDVEAVRRQMGGPFVPSVRVSGNYAKGDWYGAGGGESFFRKRDGSWRRIGGGGGAYVLADTQKMGIPQADACVLRVLLADCPQELASASDLKDARHELAAVRLYYALWGRKEFPLMWSLLSPGFTEKLEYSKWVRKHSYDTSIEVECTRIVGDHQVAATLLASGSTQSFVVWSLTEYNGWHLDEVRYPTRGQC